MDTIKLDSVDSTNLYAKENYGSFAKEGITCLIAEEQTAGRGQHQRKWISPRGVNIYATFYFQLPSSTPHLTNLAQLMALSFAKVLLEENLHPKIKWPNDIQLQGKKLSGVLCETIFQKEIVHIFLGIGINVNLENTETIDQPATSLFLETKKKWDKEALLKKLQEQFTNDLQVFKREGFTPFEDPFKQLLIKVAE
jgi:BirA family biotin operon repressor/biotin-[acetyl-CoA-carboxylase] ligase